jgi:hypothetical protein
LLVYAKTGLSFDVTFHGHGPILEVTLDDVFASKFLAAIYGPYRALHRLCGQIKFSDGTVTPIENIWTFHPMPPGGIDNGALRRADLAQAEVRAGPNGETVREMIRDTYRCGSAAEEDWFVRRWIAS